MALSGNMTYDAVNEAEGTLDIDGILIPSYVSPLGNVCFHAGETEIVLYPDEAEELVRRLIDLISLGKIKQLDLRNERGLLNLTKGTTNGV